jgi:hypothetical protein
MESADPMYEDLEPIATLKFVTEQELISNQTREKITEMQNEYAARTGPSGVQSGQHEASIGRVQIEGAERLARVLFQIWLDLIKHRNGYISRVDLGFIANKVDSFAQAQKGHLHTAFSHQRMAAVVNVLTEEAKMRMHAMAANVRRQLEIMVREHEAFPNRPNQNTERLQAKQPESEGNHIRRTASVLNILIASPSDVSEERDIVEKTILEWNATHFLQSGILLHPIRWETHAYPASGDRPQAIINKQIVESGDILIGIFGYKLGTPTGKVQSGTIEEIEEFRKAGKYVALYFSTANVPRSADGDQLEALESYKRECRNDTLYFEFEDASGLHGHLTKHLPKIVHAVIQKLTSSFAAEGVNVESARVPNNTKSQQNHAIAQNFTLLADIISELEDNLDCAERPRTGDVYRRPSTKTWIENRNRLTLPADTLSTLKNAYNRISSWADVVASGLSPNIGSPQLNLIVSDLRMSLPSLIDQLRKLQNAGSRSEHTSDHRPPTLHNVLSPGTRHPQDFLPDLNSKEIEIIVLTSRDKSGQIFHRKPIGIEQLLIGDHILLDSNNPRIRAEWIGALTNLVYLGFVEAADRNGDFYRLTNSGYWAADLLDDFARWSTNNVTIEARYMNAPTETLAISCTSVIRLPAIYYQFRIRSNSETMRSEREPQSLLIEGTDPKALNEIAWQPTHISFAVSGMDEVKSFLVERTDDRNIVKFYIRGGS